MWKRNRDYVYLEVSQDGIRELGSDPYGTLGQETWRVVTGLLLLVWLMIKWTLRLAWRILIIASIIAMYVLAMVGSFTEASRLAEDATKRNL